MKKEIFKEQEKRIIKEKLAMKSLTKGSEFDNERAYNRFEYVLSKMDPKVRQKFFNHIDYLCKTKFKAKNVYDIYTQYAYDMEDNIEKSFIFGVTRDGKVAAMFLREPFKDYVFMFTPGEYKIWEREELEKGLKEYMIENQSEDGNAWE